ncbi:AAA family ATPase [Anaerorhabdus furcosa]|nr:AAA family ATPase [Anaerorhabdus furcosa]
MSKRYIESILIKQIDDESYVKDLPVVKDLLNQGRLSFDCDVIFLVGENGTGKSTLVEAIAIQAGFNAEGGSRNFLFETRNTTSTLANYLTIARNDYPKDGFFLRAESFYNVATNIDDLDEDSSGSMLVDQYGGKSLHNQSHGESFMALVQNRFFGKGLYILDEPEAALSPSRQLTLLSEIHLLVKKNSQFIIATHSPILLSYPGALIYEIKDNEIRHVEYQDCEHVILTKEFLNCPERMLKYLLEDN